MTARWATAPRARMLFPLWFSRSETVLRSWRAGINGAAATAVGLLAGWAFDSWLSALSLVAPVVLLGGPAAVWQLLRRRSSRRALMMLSAWAAAALAAYACVVPIR